MMRTSPKLDTGSPKKQSVVAQVHAEIKARNAKEKKIKELINENLEVRKHKASELNKKIVDVRQNYRRYASEVDIAGKKRYSQDIREYEERMACKKYKDVSDEKKNFLAFRKKSKDYTNGGNRGNSADSDEIDDCQLRMDLIEGRLSDAQMRAQYRQLARHEYSLG